MEYLLDWSLNSKRQEYCYFHQPHQLNVQDTVSTLYFDTPILMSPLTNVFNFEILFSLGYDEGDWLSMKSLFKCHQGYIPISRQQAAIALRSRTIILVIKSVTVIYSPIKMKQDEIRYECTSQSTDSVSCTGLDNMIQSPVVCISLNPFSMSWNVKAW